jgi:hypothetical protein
MGPPLDRQPLDRHCADRQVATGAALGIAAQGLLVIPIIGYIMPLLGLELLDMARDVAAFNLPARTAQLFGISLQRTALSADWGGVLRRLPLLGPSQPAPKSS